MNLVMSGKVGGKTHALIIGTSLDGGRKGDRRGNKSRKGKGSSQQEEYPINNSQTDRRLKEKRRRRGGGGGCGSGWGFGVY